MRRESGDYSPIPPRHGEGGPPAAGGSAVTASYLRCGSAICQARNASNATTREYLDEGEYVPGATPATYYYGPDQIGSARRVFASTSSAPAFSYDPYGVPLQATTPVTDFNYAGAFFNADSGLDLTQYRAYDPVAGRWLSRDPVGEVSNPVGNLYPYVDGDPLRYTDPDGRFGVPGALVGALVGGLGDAALQLLRNGGTQCFSLPEALGAAAVGALIGATDGFGGAALLELEGEGGLIAGEEAGAGDAAGAGSGPGGGIKQPPTVQGWGNVGGGSTTVENALSQAENYLGEGYNEIAPGVYRSADGLRQFRMTDRDLLDTSIGPHVHFEAIGPDGRTIIENSHVTLTNP